MKMVVAGAGLVGSAMAIALKQKGYEVELYEKRTDPRADEATGGRSINLIITAKGIHLFKNLGLWEDIKKITVPVYGRTMHSKEGDLTYQPYGKDETEYNHSVSRSMLNNLLLNKVDSFHIPLHFDYSVEKIDFKKKLIQFNKEDVAFDKLFGCDGAGSKVREPVLEELGDAASCKVEPLGVDYKEFLMPANEQGHYAIDEKSLHIRASRKPFFDGLTQFKGSFTMTLYMPTDWFHEYNQPEKVQAYFEENYKDSLPLMPNFLVEYNKNPQGFLGTVRMSQWVLGDTVMLMGDAAHAIVPFFGQGMNCGMSDVQYFLDHINEDNWIETFNNYQEHQKLNGDAIADLSLDNFIEMSERVGDEKFLFKKKVENILENHFPEKYRSRYAMTVYTLIPYHHAKAAGELQQELLDELVRDLDTPENVDLEKAEKLIDGMLTPWFRKRNIQLERFPSE